jgi:hypothetical protein
MPRLFLTALFLGLALSRASAQTDLRTVPYADLQPQHRYDMKAAKTWKLPAQVSFEIEGGPVVDGDRVRLVGWLTNASPDPQLAVIFPVGALGFWVHMPHCINRPSTGPLMPMPAPPPPLALTLPGLSRFRMESGFSVSSCDWEPGKPREIEWGLLFWNEPKPQGVVLLP